MRLLNVTVNGEEALYNASFKVRTKTVTVESLIGGAPGLNQTCSGVCSFNASACVRCVTTWAVHPGKHQNVTWNVT
jgi:hypothetical protein